MKRWIRDWWFIWALGAFLALASQVVWLRAHRWDQAFVRLTMGPLAGAIIIGSLAWCMDRLAKRLGLFDLKSKIKALGGWLADLIAKLTGLNTKKGRLAWPVGILILLVGLGLAGIYQKVMPQIGQGLVRSFFIEHQAKDAKGLSIFFYDCPDRAAPPICLGAGTDLSWPDVKSFPGRRKQGFEMRLLGMLSITRKGKYTFGGQVDDGFRILINGKPILEDFKQAPAHENWSTISLEPGLYAFEVRYFQARGLARLELYWQQPGKPREPLGLAPITPLKCQTPLVELDRLELKYRLVPEDRFIYPPFGEGRRWRLLWW